MSVSSFFLSTYFGSSLDSPPLDGNGDSLVFNGTSYLQYAGSPNFDPLEGDFTIEWFQWIPKSQVYGRVFSIGTYDGGGATLAASIEDMTLYFWVDGALISTQSSIDLQTWKHVAITREDGILRTFVGGTMMTSQTFSNTIAANGEKDLFIGSEDGTNVNSNLIGYLSNFRYIVGSALYTGDFTPPTARLTNVSGTELLILGRTAGNPGDDSSSPDHQPTNVGVTTIEASPF